MTKPRVTLADLHRDEVRLGIETVTPERAYQLLCANLNNRRLRQRDVAKYARDMRDGKWRRGAGEPIHIAPDGEVGNGQHRLYAVIEAGVPVDLPILYAPKEYRQVADQGIKRSFADVLKIEYGEEQWVTVYAAAIRLLWEYRKTGVIGTKIPEAPTTSELVEVYLGEPDLKRSLARGRRTNDRSGVRPALAATFHYLFSQVDREDADRFFDRLSDGVGLTERDPILAARLWFFGRSRTDSNRDQAMVLIRAFNYMRAGQRTKYFKQQGDFPEIEGLS